VLPHSRVRYILPSMPITIYAAHARTLHCLCACPCISLGATSFGTVWCGTNPTRNYAHAHERAYKHYALRLLRTYCRFVAVPSSASMPSASSSGRPLSSASKPGNSCQPLSTRFSPTWYCRTFFIFTVHHAMVRCHRCIISRTRPLRLHGAAPAAKDAPCSAALNRHFGRFGPVAAPYC